MQVGSGDAVRLFAVSVCAASSGGDRVQWSEGVAER